MCGIVASLGSRPASPFIIQGLKALEYRGYDSAGLAVMGAKGVKCIKAVGQVSRLERKVKFKRPAGKLGIGHTRWATHGRVLVKNAHPHCDDKGQFFVVHNGIIENFAILKEFLIKKGHKFSSDTDSEVVAQLLAYNFKQVGDVRQAIFLTLRSLKGAYALAIISEKEPGKLWGAKLSGPLVLGIGEQQFYLASDPMALANFSRRMIVLEDNEVVEITTEGYTISNLESEKTVKRPAALVDLADKEAGLGGYSDYMSKEIAESPRVVEDVTRGRLNSETGIVKLGGLDTVASQLEHIDRILIIACGTSYFAGMVGEYLFEEISQIPVEVQLASEFRYRNEPLSRSTAVIVISQSGETADTIAALQKISDSGILKLGVVNVVGSTLSRLTDAGVYCQAGLEKSVASTKSFIAQVTVLVMMALYLNNHSPLYNELLRGLTDLPEQMRGFLKSNSVAKIAKKYAKYNNFLFLGRRYAYPVALEGALKLKEISYIHAEGLAGGEIKHGSLALVDKNCPCFATALSNGIDDKTVNSLAEIKARKGKIVAVVDDPKSEAAKLTDDLIVVPKVPEALQPLVAGLACHLFAYHVAKTLKRPIDKPRNLAKSVTVE
ncbi:glutamine--fructose-6-phosphate transaminase (isomerizing) [Candidatus Saccharibacteria bacterium]|nr:glutamine--fructose-6-phosphate transaminase (isomerizing) [Candidatus Saccharibacteria bacterium]